MYFFKYQYTWKYKQNNNKLTQFTQFINVPTWPDLTVPVKIPLLWIFTYIMYM